MDKKTTGKREERLRQAYDVIEKMALGERKAPVQLALKSLLVIRGALDPRVINEKVYSTLVKYIRASSVETLPALIDDVLDKISPQFIPHSILGNPIQDIYEADDTQAVLELLQEETIPLVILMKKVYNQFVEPEETSKEEA